MSHPFTPGAIGFRREWHSTRQYISYRGSRLRHSFCEHDFKLPDDWEQRKHELKLFHDLIRDWSHPLTPGLESIQSMIEQRTAEFEAENEARCSNHPTLECQLARLAEND